VSDIAILCLDKPGIHQETARKLVEFTGATARFVNIDEPLCGCEAAVVHADVLASAQQLTPAAPYVFVYGFTHRKHASLLQTISAGALQGTEASPAGAPFHVTKEHRDWFAQLSDVSVSTADSQRDLCFVEGDRPHDTLIYAGGRPFFTRVKIGGREVFVLASGELADPDEVVPRDSGLLPWFSRTVPFMVFLRRVLGDRVWRNDRPQACVIIDDPLLKSKYGFLEYSKLIDAMRRFRFATCIGFIPWNYRRSNRRIAQKFQAAGESLSICVHGCDHTGAEFAPLSKDASLGPVARLALDRMEAHKRRSGVPFSDVMVFPQGRFSAEGVRALDAAGYLAAVNTHLHPAFEERRLMLRDMMDVAVTAYGNLPLFGRHYPKDPAEFAMDLFLGKPAFVVEHHGCFRDGYESLGTFVQQLNALDDRIEWRSLATICSQACLKRTTPDGDTEVRIFANRFRLTNDSDTARIFHVIRSWKWGGFDPTFEVDGAPFIHEISKGRLRITLTLDPRRSANIRIRVPATQAERFQPTAKHNFRVLVRRVLSEFRDNYVDTSRVLSGLLTVARKLRSRNASGKTAARPAAALERAAL
jgi:hypothetical protein